MRRRRNLRAAVTETLRWVEEQQDYCRPPELRDAPADVLNDARGSCAAYGAAVYGLVADRLREDLRLARRC